MQKIYEIVIFTASLSLYADPLLDVIDSSNCASYRLFRDHCTLYNNTFVKDLSALGRDLKKLMIVDNSPSAYLFQPENAIPILSWNDDLKDTKLTELADALELLVYVEDVREVIKKNVINNTMDYVKLAETLKTELIRDHKLNEASNSTGNKKLGVMRKAVSLDKKEINGEKESIVHAGKKSARIEGTFRAKSDETKKKTIGKKNHCNDIKPVKKNLVKKPCPEPIDDIALKKQKEMNKKRKKCGKTIVDAVPEFSKYTEEEFGHARMLVSSRIFGITVDGKKTDSMVPLSDMLNHRCPQQTSWEYKEEYKAFIIDVKESIPRGDEIYDSYGQKCK